MQNPDELWQLAKTIAHFLEPFIPYLVIGTQKAAEEAGKKAGYDALEKVKNLWGRLCSKEKPELKEAAGNMLVSPTDPEIKQALIQEIRKSLEEDPDLTKEIESMMKDSVIQRVIAKGGSVIENVKQNSTGNNKVSQEVIADNSTIKGVEQTQNVRY